MILQLKGPGAEFYRNRLAKVQKDKGVVTAQDRVWAFDAARSIPGTTTEPAKAELKRAA
jgi:hypothetical protein